MPDRRHRPFPVVRLRIFRPPALTLPDHRSIIAQSKFFGRLKKHFVSVPEIHGIRTIVASNRMSYAAMVMDHYENNNHGPSHVNVIALIQACGRGRVADRTRVS